MLIIPPDADATRSMQEQIDADNLIYLKWVFALNTTPDHRLVAEDVEVLYKKTPLSFFVKYPGLCEKLLCVNGLSEWIRQELFGVIQR
jgi:hypothetical protein